MKYLFLSVILLVTARFCQGGPLRLQKRAAFYIANETACVVDNTVYSNGDPIPTDDPCEACKCRPPGFACVLKECEVKPGCRAVRRVGYCCPEYICGCEHNGRMYRDGDEIQDTQNPCYTCHCQGSSIACAFVDCFFRVDCAPEYVAGECCPRYTHCSSLETNVTGVDLPFDKTDSGIEVTTISYISPETTQRYQDQTERASSEITHDEAIGEEAPSTPSLEPERRDPIHFVADTIREEYASETQDRGSNSNSQTPEEKDKTTQPIHDDSAEIQEDSTNETSDKSDLLNTDSEIKEHVEEEPEKTSDESSSESTIAGSDISASSESTISIANVEIFADETTQGHKFEATTATQDPSLSYPKTTEAPATKDEIEIETNTIEKRYRSLENATAEDTTSETAQYEKDKPIIPEAASTEAPEEKLSAIQEIGTSTQVPETYPSSEVSESKDTTISDQTTNQSLYYKAENKILEAVGTVTAGVNVHEETSSSENYGVKTSTSVPSSEEQNLSTQTSVPKETIGYENVDKVFSEVPY